MPYVQDICLALARVMENAVFHKDIRIAGYAANIEFWADEIRHAMDCLAGYDTRFRKLKEARVKEAAKHHVAVDPVWVTPTLTEGELERLQNRLRASATAFMRACCPYVDPAIVRELEVLLGMRIQDRRALD